MFLPRLLGFETGEFTIMKKYIALYMAPVGAFDEMIKNPDPKAMKETNESWNKWAKSHEKSFVDQGGPVGKNKRVTKEGIKDVRNEVTGYSFVQANSHEEAAKMFQDNPSFAYPGAYVEVIECTEMPGST